MQYCDKYNCTESASDVTSGVIVHNRVYFASLSLDMAALSVNEFDSVSSVCDHDRRAFDPLPPLPKIDSSLSRLHSPVYLPNPTAAANFSMSPSAPYNFVPDANSYISMPGANGAGSIVSSSGMTARRLICCGLKLVLPLNKLLNL